MGGLRVARRIVAPYGVRAKTKEADEKWCRLYCVGAGLCSAQSSNYDLAGSLPLEGR